MRKTNGIKQIFLWLIGFLLIAGIYNSLTMMESEKEVPYSYFKSKLKNKEVKKVYISNDVIRGELVDNNKTVKFKTLPLNDPDLVKDMEASGVENFSGVADRSWITTVIFNIGWILLFVLAWWFIFFRQANVTGKQAMNFAKSKARQIDPKKNKITFKDVAGCDEAKEELADIVDYLKNPDKYKTLGGTLPKGVLLYGAPGTGKTLLAKAVAGEAGVSFFSASGSEFVEMFVGVGAARVRDLFERAKKNAPAIIFVDELDAVGRHRFAGIGGGHDEREQTLNQLLIELDGFEVKEGIILIAATNRPDVLDPALLRPGRFDRRINVPIPDIKGRTEILKVHAKKIKLSESVDLSVIAQRTPGFSGADLANIINEAAIIAAKKNKESVEFEELEEAIEKTIAGPQRRSRIISEKEKKIIAYHEAGHALVAKLLKDTDPVHKISIIPRGPALGYTLQLPQEDKYLTSKSEILSKLSILLAGRASEEVVFGEITTGAGDDLSKATAYAQKMVMEFGMSEKIGPLSLKKDENEVFLGRDIVKQHSYSNETAKNIDDEIKRIVNDAYYKAKSILMENKLILDKIVEKLMEKETINGEELDLIVNS
ncbi:MAG TPA: ATP-dependent zinc metalloprotease FtsH [Elusimicrobiales bacterium]|nr:ATP-dependent zinc metalloprotease FtsH [Elusimicrobiales bacterium]HPO95703.1 ATP-dependent zinc metalloprotease FtsH [Elusimicrobiales bacterium]